jgi:O-antigen/teichoic acid export membrane protein
MAGITALISLANDVATASRSRETITSPADEQPKPGKRSLIARLRQDELTWNSLFLVLSTGLQSGTGFLFWIITTHLFSVPDVGKGSALITGINLIGNLSLIGLNIGMGRYLPTTRNRDALISSGVAMVAVIGILAALVYVQLTPYVASGLAFVQKNPVLTVSFALICAATAVNTLTDVIFIASRKAKYTTLVDGVIAGFGKLILAALLTSLGAYGLFLASALGTVMAAVASLLLILMVMRVRVDLRHPFKTLKPLIRFSGANYVGNVINLIDALIVPLIVLDRLGADDAAYFFVVLQMAQIVYTAALALEQTFLAEGSRADADMRQLRRRSLRLLVLFFVPIAVFMIGAGRWLLLAFGHPYYQHGYVSLIALTLAAAPISASFWFMTILRLAGKLRSIIVVNIIGFVVTVSLVWLGSSHGLTAVAWAWFVSCAVTALAAGVAARARN